jgi:hypothetical protein
MNMIALQALGSFRLLVNVTSELGNGAGNVLATARSSDTRWSSASGGGIHGHTAIGMVEGACSLGDMHRRFSLL